VVGWGVVWCEVWWGGLGFLLGFFLIVRLNNNNNNNNNNNTYIHIYIGRLISFASTVIFLFTLDISG
jgi:hypothetical protein